MIIDVSELFCESLLYVALSRSTDLENVQIIGKFNVKDKGCRPS